MIIIGESNCLPCLYGKITERSPLSTKLFKELHNHRKLKLREYLEVMNT